MVSSFKQQYRQSAEDQGKPQKSSLRIANTLAEIWVGHILNTGPKTVATTSAC